MARTKSLRSLTWVKSQGICFLCGMPMWLEGDQASPLTYTLEHVIPRARGGANELFNLEGAHQWCNNWKGDSLMEELPRDYRKFLKWKIKNLIANQKPTKIQSEKFLQNGGGSKDVG